MAGQRNSLADLAVAGIFAYLPQLLLGPFAGVWVDRLRRKTVIIAADLFIGLVPQGELVRANSLSQFLQSGSFLLGPALQWRRPKFPIRRGVYRKSRTCSAR